MTAKGVKRSRLAVRSTEEMSDCDAVREHVIGDDAAVAAPPS
jgi:hypothetical protein